MQKISNSKSKAAIQAKCNDASTVIHNVHVAYFDNKLVGSLLKSNPFERPMQISADFKKTSALA